MKLTNQEIWLAFPNMKKLSQLTFPVRVSLSMAKVMNKLQRPYLVIEEERAKLVRKYGVLDEEGKKYKVEATNGDYALEFAELLTSEWEDDFQFEKIQLPERIKGLCDKCKQNTDIVFLIDPNTLMPLAEKFVEVIP